MIYHKDVPVAALAVRILKLEENPVSTDTIAPRRNGSYRTLARPSEAAVNFAPEVPGRSVMLCGDYYVGGFHGILLRDESELGKLWPAITTLLLG